jgi:hypothetical protein
MPSRSPRLRYEGLERVCYQEENNYEIVVKLSFNEKPFYGKSYGEIGESRELVAAARAALQAVEDFVENRFECTLIDVDRVEAIGSKLIVLLVSVNYDKHEQQIFGSCRADSNLLDACVRAALDATNRYVELALASEQNSSLVKQTAANRGC